MITITEQAKKHLIAMLEKTGRPAVELSLTEQGCNGFKYTWTPVTTNFGDHVYALDDDYSLVVNDQTMNHVKGSDIILELTGFDKRLTVSNPNVDGQCGCGESVNFK